MDIPAPPNAQLHYSCRNVLSPILIFLKYSFLLPRIKEVTAVNDKFRQYAAGVFVLTYLIGITIGTVVLIDHKTKVASFSFNIYVLGSTILTWLVICHLFNREKDIINLLNSCDRYPSRVKQFRRTCLSVVLLQLAIITA